MKRSQLQELIKEMIQIIPEEKAKGTNGKACWDGYRYAGTKNGKDVCVKTGKGKTKNETTDKVSIDKLASGFPYKIEGGKAIIATWMPDESKENIIRKCKKAGYRCVPNNAGGVNIKLT